MSPSDADCPIYEPCVLRTALTNASQAFLDELNKWTLADLIRKRKPLLIASKDHPSPGGELVEYLR